VPWPFGNEVPGASVPDNSEWNDTMPGTDGRYVSFVDAHFYLFGGSRPDSRGKQSPGKSHTNHLEEGHL
jgi:hypothetical protein